MHGVVVIPLAAPDEAVAFEDFDNWFGDFVIVFRHNTRLSARPAPVICEFYIKINCGAKTMYAKPFGARNPAPIKSTGRDFKKLPVLFIEQF